MVQCRSTAGGKFKWQAQRRKCRFEFAKRFVNIGLFILCAIALGKAQAMDAGITFEHRERSLQPGEVILVKAHSSRPLKYLHAGMFDREFPTFGTAGGFIWTGLIGIDLETKPGRYVLMLQGADPEGKAVTTRKYLQIAAKKFPTRNLAVDEKYVTPPADVVTRIEEENKKVDAIFVSVSPDKIWSGPFRAPVPGEVISVFGKRNVYNHQPRSPHSGVDFRGPVGTPVRAPNNGRVALAANLYFSGNTIILDHGLGLYSYLGHLSAFSVTEGDLVKSGSIIGKVGATGRVTGPHLHWTVRLNGARVDPMSLISILKETQ